MDNIVILPVTQRNLVSPTGPKARHIHRDRESSGGESDMTQPGPHQANVSM